MPVSTATPVLAAGLAPMFTAATSPATTEQAAQTWAEAYADYIKAGGITAAPTRVPAFASALASAFRPELAGGGPALFVAAFQVFWIGLLVPAQSGIVSAFVPITLDVNSPQPAEATPQQQANGLAQIIAGLTLGSVKVQVPPGVIVPLL